MAQKNGRAWLLGGVAALVVAIAAGFAVLRHGGPASAPSPTASASTLLSPSVNELRWQDLTPAQQEALAPLKSGWDDLGPVRKQKWLEIAGRYASMKPTEKKRMLERMRAWTEMSPEERKAVRENYARAQRAVGGKKAAQWEEYLQLSDEEKRKLAKAGTAKKQQVAKPPTPAQSLAKTPQPVKPHVPAVPPPAVATMPPPAPVPLPPPLPQPAQELVYPLEGAATPAVMLQQNPPAPAPAPAMPAPPAATSPAPATAPAPAHTASPAAQNATR
ncbi:DUF3106 domain-containing protein [Pseudoduganella albidiflava]|uniref:DUF3106 domain-containing protein n=1 Tax=Pseudoduganella albidiflava TaxID=321983 RepID=A0A411WUV0_9BURK|nr:DUF3106 domain-containing protein [Pseudoduganella albidiflava]QBI00536.1 DUF3106 domain-containing protein [Pseudoduganella albidiflava]GGY32532.1 hypothetical protein GCM10007387_13420 [Pseudoduganella albidiflava]